MESFGGEYLVRSENVHSFHEKRNPQRVIVIRFSSREQLNLCFSSMKYMSVKNLRENSVDARGIIVEV